MKLTSAAAAAALALVQGAAGAETVPSTSASIAYHRADVGGVSIFYREAGPKDGPAVVLLHGYPSSSRMYDPLIPLLADRIPRDRPIIRPSGRAGRRPPNMPTRSTIWPRR